MRTKKNKKKVLKTINTNYKLIGLNTSTPLYSTALAHWGVTHAHYTAQRRRLRGGTSLWRRLYITASLGWRKLASRHQMPLFRGRVCVQKYVNLRSVLSESAAPTGRGWSPGSRRRCRSRRPWGRSAGASLASWRRQSTQSPMHLRNADPWLRTIHNTIRTSCLKRSATKYLLLDHMSIY